MWVFFVKERLGFTEEVFRFSIQEGRFRLQLCYRYTRDIQSLILYFEFTFTQFAVGSNPKTNSLQNYCKL
jgi:hypothetical protein